MEPSKHQCSKCGNWKKNKIIFPNFGDYFPIKFVKNQSQCVEIYIDDNKLLICRKCIKNYDVSGNVSKKRYIGNEKKV